MTNLNGTQAVTIDPDHNNYQTGKHKDSQGKYIDLSFDGALPMPKPKEKGLRLEPEDSHSSDEQASSEDYDEEDEFQKEVDNIINSVINLDLGDAKSNKNMKNKMNKYKEENKHLTDALSVRSKKSNYSKYSGKTFKSFRTNRQSQRGGPPTKRAMNGVDNKQAKNLNLATVGKPIEKGPSVKFEEKKNGNNHYQNQLKLVK